MPMVSYGDVSFLRWKTAFLILNSDKNNVTSSEGLHTLVFLSNLASWLQINAIRSEEGHILKCLSDM